MSCKYNLHCLCLILLCVLSKKNFSFNSYLEVFLQSWVVNMNGKNKPSTARIIIDTFSEKSYITKSAAKEGYECLRQEIIIHAVFG